MQMMSKPVFPASASLAVPHPMFSAPDIYLPVPFVLHSLLNQPYDNFPPNSFFQLNHDISILPLPHLETWASPSFLSPSLVTCIALSHHFFHSHCPLSFPLHDFFPSRANSSLRSFPNARCICLSVHHTIAGHSISVSKPLFLLSQDFSRKKLKWFPTC